MGCKVSNVRFSALEGFGCFSRSFLVSRFGIIQDDENHSSQQVHADTACLDFHPSTPTPHEQVHCACAHIHPSCHSLNPYLSTSPALRCSPRIHTAPARPLLSTAEAHQLLPLPQHEVQGVCGSSRERRSALLQLRMLRHVCGAAAAADALLDPLVHCEAGRACCWLRWLL